MTIISLPREEFLQKYREKGGEKPAWYVKYLLRGFTDMKDIYVIRTAFSWAKETMTWLLLMNRGISMERSIPYSG